MKCQVCNAETAAESVFCPKCGAKLQDPAAGFEETDSSAPQAVASSASSSFSTSGSSSSSRTRDVPEETLWEGSYSPKAMLGTIVLCVLLSIGLLVVALVFSTSAALTWVLLAGIVVVWLVAAVRLGANRLGRSYKLTNQMFYHREGVLNRRTDRIELIEVHDVTWEQGLFERIVGVGTITITSADRTDPKLPIRGIENVESVASQIDKARRSEQVRRGRRIDFSNVDHQT